MKDGPEDKLKGLDLDISRIIEGVVVFSGERDLIVMSNEGEKIDVSLSKETVFVSMEISMMEKETTNQIEISRNEIAEGDGVSIFFDGSRERPTARIVRKIVDIRDKLDDRDFDGRGSMDLDYIKVSSLSENGVSIISDKFRRSKEGDFRKLMKMMNLRYRLLDHDPESDHIRFTASRDDHEFDDLHDGGSEETKRGSFFKETKLLLESRSLGVEYIKILSLIHGIKPMIYDSIAKNKKDDLIHFLDSNKIFHLFFGNEKSPNFTACENSSVEYFAISKDPSKISEFGEISFMRDDNENHVRVGNLLGYPECCSKSYSEQSLKSPELRVRDNYYEAVVNSKRFHPFNNNTFCFYSKGDIYKGKERLDKKHDETFLNFEYPYFISHLPCSFDCKGSLEYGKKVYGALKAEDPDAAELMLSILSKPVLFFGPFDFIVFEGEADRKELYYRGILPPLSLIDDDKLAKFIDGDRLTVFDDEIKVFKGDKVIHTIEKREKEDGFIIPFSRG